MNDFHRITPPAIVKTPAPFVRFVRASAEHTLFTMPKRKMSLLAAFLAYAPVAIPLALLLPRDIFFEVEGRDVFVQIVQFVYINALCPLLALFFGCMLIGEDIESNTFPYVLSRPIPRPAWVLGKFLGYLIGVSILLGASIFLTYLASTRLSNFPVSRESLTLLGQYLGSMVLALGAYGAISLLLGASMKRPMIGGIFLFFFWQKIALALPGYVDFFTVDKYVGTVLPDVEGMKSLLEVAAQLMGGKLFISISPLAAGLTLAGIAFAGVALTSWVVMQREYTAAHAAGS